MILTAPDTVALFAGAVMVTALTAAELCGFVFATAWVGVDPSNVRMARKMARLLRVRRATAKKEIIGVMPLELR